jgi:branched-chain amino acid transport system substrate-binding protein
MPSMSRRQVMRAASGLAAAAMSPLATPAIAQAKPLKVGLLLPYSGTFAQLGEAITRAIELYVRQQGGALAGRPLSFVKLDDESEPPKAADLTTKLVHGEKVDVLVGSVHSGVAMAMSKIAREEGLPTIIPNAGADILTRALCARNVFRSSFSNGQVGLACGKAVAEAGVKRVVTMNWRYAAGEETLAGFRDAFGKGGGRVLKEIMLPFPNVEFQAAFTEIAALKPDAVFAFFAGGGAVKFLTDYNAAGLRRTIPLWGPGFLTDGVDAAAGEGLMTVMHYADDYASPENKAFRAAFEDAYKIPADVYAVQGWDAMALLDAGLKAVSGDVGKRDALLGAMSQARFESPRGPFRLSAAHNPVQNFYLREFKGGRNALIKVSAEAFSDPATGCRLKA